MKNKKRTAAWLAGCLVMTGVLSACSGGSSGSGESTADTQASGSSASSSGDVITLTFPCIWVGSDSKAEVFGQMVKDFNAEYEGEIEIVIEEQTDYDAYRDKIRTQLSAGSAPDIFTVESYADLELFVESGKLMDMTEFLSEGEVAERFTEGIVENGKVDGVSYAFPYENAYIPILYNMDLLEQVGVTAVPTTYDELWDLCERLQEAGIFATTQMTNDNAWTSMLWYSYAVASCGGTDVYENGLDDPAFVEAAEILQKMFEYTSSDAVGADATVVNGHFFNERAAVYTNGTWIFGRIQTEGTAGLYDNIQIGPSMSADGENGGAYLEVIQAYVCASAQEDPARTEAIEKFFEFITREDKIVELSNSSGSTFAIETDAAKIEDELLAETVAAGAAASFTIGHFQGSVSTAAANAFPAALESLVLGDVDPQGFVDMLKAAE